MKLRYSSTSPYARKVLVCAAERGLSETIEIIATVPGNLESGLRAENPLDKVPALITDDGMALYDSPVICEYLDSLPGGPALFPPAGADRWRALRLQALADGLLDAALAPETQAVYEANIKDAIHRSVFGSPTYFVDGDMFYGQDRLDLVERAPVTPFAGDWPPRSP